MVRMNKLVILVEKDSKGLKKHLHEIVFGYYSEKYEVSNREVEIKRDNGGKPFIIVQGEKLSEFFNISHTSGVGVVIFSNYEIGIDIEGIVSPDDRIAQRFFHKNERRYLYDGVGETEYRKRFYEIWTKKEAYLKWNGMGLAGGLRNLNVLTKRYAFQRIEINGKEYALAVYAQ